MTHPTWLEVAINGPWSRVRQPNIPVLADEIVEQALACAAEGASIIHFHAYDPDTGRQRDDYEIYAPIIERIRARADVICYGTLPFAGSVDAPSPLSPAQRYAAVDKLVRAGLIEWSVVDPGSTNISHYADIQSHKEGFVYANPESHVRYGLGLAQQHHITPSYAIYEPGFMRLGAALRRTVSNMSPPVYRLMFSDNFTFGFPPEEWAVEAYVRLLGIEEPDAQWMVAGLGVQIDPLVDFAVTHGGHIRVGLEDAPLGHAVSNVEQVRVARARIERNGGTPATAAQVRERLNA